MLLFHNGGINLVYRLICRYHQNAKHRFNFSCILLCGVIPYFFGYKTELFSFLNNPKDLDPSYKKMDLDLWDCLGRVKLIL